MKSGLSIRERLGSEHGQAIVLAMAIVAIALLLGLTSVTLAISADHQSSNSERLRAAQQASSAGIQQQVLNQSDSDAVGYNFNGGAAQLGQLLDCSGVQMASNTTISGSVQFGLSSATGPCPPAVSTNCSTGAPNCSAVSNPWTAAGNGAYFESEFFPNATVQTNASQPNGSAYAVEFPEILSVGCQTRSATPPASCSSGDAANQYARQLAILNPTAPLQALEGENDVTVTSPTGLSALTGLLSGLGVSLNTGSAVVDGNIVAGNNISLPAGATANLNGAQVGSAVLSVLAGSAPTVALSQLTSPALNATLSYGNTCTAGLSAIACTSTNPLASDVVKTTSGQCQPGTPTPTCFLKRPGFSLNGASATTCASIAGVAINSGACSGGYLTGNSSGNVVLEPGTYLFCNVNVTGTISQDQSNKGPVQIFVAAPGQDGCAQPLAMKSPAASASTTSITAGGAVSFTGLTPSGGSGTYSYGWSLPGGSTTSSNTQSPSGITYSTPGVYTAVYTVTDTTTGQSASYDITIIVAPSTTLKALVGTPTALLGTATFTGSATGGYGTYTYSWNCGNGTSGTSQTQACAYLAAGSYTVTLKVTDAHGNTATQTVSVTVAGAVGVGLSASIGTPSASTAGGTISTTASVSAASPTGTGVATSPASGIAAQTTFTFAAIPSGDTYSWSFGDGTTASVQNPTHQYAAAGTYIATVYVTDGAGKAGSATVAVTVSGGSTTSVGGNFVAQGGVNDLVQGLVNTGSSGTRNVDPSAFQIYVAGNPADATTMTTGDTNCLTSGSSGCPSTAVVIGSTSTVPPQIGVVYAPLSTVNVTSVTAAEGAFVGWDLNVDALTVVQDLDLGNFPLSSVANAYSIHQIAQCNTAVTSFAVTSNDLTGCP